MLCTYMLHKARIGPVISTEKIDYYNELIEKFSNNSRRSVSNCLECFDKISQIFSYFWKFSLVMDGMAMSAKKINVIRRYTTNLFNFHENANFDLHKTFT
jgi:hypothetical protein